MENYADLLVIFGITGELARRMTLRALYSLERRGLLDCPVIGVACEDMTTGELVKQAREAIVDSGQDVDDAVFGRLARRMSYLSFGKPSITVDTHFARLARRFGWTAQTDPEKIEQDVGALLPRREWTAASHRVIWHGRRVCHARRPACGACGVAPLCFCALLALENGGKAPSVCSPAG